MKPILLCLVVAFACTSGLLNAQDISPKPSFKNVTSTARMRRLRQELPAAIRKKVSELSPAEKAIAEKYFKTEPFANQSKLLLGIWHGVSEDADYKSYWTYERRADGTMRSVGIDLMPAEREYDDVAFDVVWLARGRVVFEQKASDTGTVDIYLLESLSDQAIKYRIMFDGEPEDTWAEETDKRGLGAIPKPPADWTKATQ